MQCGRNPEEVCAKPIKLQSSNQVSVMSIHVLGVAKDSITDSTKTLDEKTIH